MAELKQVILVRTDLKLPRGKMAAQVAHASVEAVLRSSKEIVREWREAGQKKVVLKIGDEKELLDYNMMAKDMGLVSAVITDAGMTVLLPGTVTCLGIGPDSEDRIDKLTGKLKMA